MLSSLLKGGLCCNWHSFPILWKGWLLKVTSCSEGPQIQDLPARKEQTGLGWTVGSDTLFTPQALLSWCPFGEGIPQYSQLHLLSDHVLSCVCTSLAVLHLRWPVVPSSSYWPTDFSLKLLSECWIDCWLSTLPFYCNRTSNFSCPEDTLPRSWKTTFLHLPWMYEWPHRTELWPNEG